MLLFSILASHSCTCISYFGLSNGRHIFATYLLAVQLPLLKSLYRWTGRNTLQPWVNNSLNLNLIVCQKSQLSQKRISLLKRKAPPRGKGAEREGKVKTQRARFTEPGFFFSRLVSHSGLAVYFICTHLPPLQVFFTCKHSPAKSCWWRTPTTTKGIVASHTCTCR